MTVRRALFLVAVAASSLLTAPLPTQQVVVCGADELFILDLATPTPRKVWSWRARCRSTRSWLYSWYEDSHFAP